MNNNEKYKDLLSKELVVLEKELGTVGRKNPENPADWEAVEPKLDVDNAEEGEVAGGIEQYENNIGVVDQLEARLREVKEALAKIDTNTFGVCEVCGEQIEEDRLSANPAAKTCKTHMNG